MIRFDIKDAQVSVVCILAFLFVMISCLSLVEFLLAVCQQVCQQMTNIRLTFWLTGFSFNWHHRCKASLKKESNNMSKELNKDLFEKLVKEKSRKAKTWLMAFKKGDKKKFIKKCARSRSGFNTRIGDIKEYTNEEFGWLSQI